MKKIFAFSVFGLMFAPMTCDAVDWWRQETVCRLDTTTCYPSMGTGYDREMWDASSQCWGMKLICPDALVNNDDYIPVPMGKTDIARGDKIKVRHILLKPKVTQEEIDQAKLQLDSIAGNIRSGKFSFEEAASFLSDDKDTRNNNGLMANMGDDGRMTSRFQMRNLPSEIARVVDTLKVGEVSAPFQMISEKNGKTLCAVVKLKNRVETHRATITEDFQAMKNIVLAKRKEEFIDKWIKDKIKTTYVRINDRYKSCDFKYEGWVR